MNEERFLKVAEVEKIVGMSRRSIYRKMDSGTFPSSIRVGPNSVRWSSLEVDEWKAAKRAGEEWRAAA